MPYTIALKNLMLAAAKGTNPTTPITHVGAATKSADVTGVTGTASTDLINKTAHGLANGTIVTFTGLTGGLNIVAGRIYFVISTLTNTFQISTAPGGTAVDFTTDLTALTALNSWVEISGGSYARVAIAYNAPVDGTMDDSTNGAQINIPAVGNVDAVTYHSASTAGTLLGLDPKTRESFASAGIYNVTDSDLDLNAVG